MKGAIKEHPREGGGKGRPFPCRTATKPVVDGDKKKNGGGGKEDTAPMEKTGGGGKKKEERKRLRGEKKVIATKGEDVSYLLASLSER